jgi:hypothetical protein
MKKLILILFSLYIPLSFAQNWQEVGENQFYKISLNTSSIEPIYREGQNLLQGWTNWQVYTERGPKDELRGDFTMVMYYMNCQNQTMAEASRTRYLSTGKELGSQAMTWHDLKPVAQNTLGFSILQAACKQQKVIP